MAITQRAGVNPATMADNWAKGVAAGGANWLAGIKGPRHLPNENPAHNGANWIAGVQAAEPAYVAGVSKPDYLARLEAGAAAKQASFSGAGTAHKADFTAFASKAAPLYTAGHAALGPKGPRGTNGQRALQWAQATHALKGQFKAR